MESAQVGLLLLLGLSLLGGAVGAWMFQRLHIPQVVGYVAIGLALGSGGLGVIRPDELERLHLLNLFALGMIGFLVGGELRIEIFRKYAGQFLAILLGEGMAAFLLVGGGTFLILWTVLADTPLALAAAIVFGAIASATDPASTIDVLWEYRARGILTTSITAIVALDDALAMTLYGLGTGAAQLLTGHQADFLRAGWKIAIEILGAMGGGAVFALLLDGLLRQMRRPERALAIALAMILLLSGVAIHSGMDLILATMTMGFTLVNRDPRRSEEIFTILRGFSAPIYVLFFVMVGARMNPRGLPLWLWVIVAAYVLGRNFGKILGSWIGARATGAAPVVQRYLGFGIFAQGGVAVGLSIMAGHHLSGIPVAGGLSLGDAIVFAVTATTLLVQISGPPLVRWAIVRAGEAGRNVTDEDVIAESTVADVMDREVEVFREEMPLAAVIDGFARGHSDVVPVVGSEGELLGTISLQGMRNILADQSTWRWLLVSDAVEPAADTTRPDAPLGEALRYMNQLHLAQMPVVEVKDGKKKPVGMLDLQRARRRIAEEVLRRQGDMAA